MYVFAPRSLHSASRLTLRLFPVYYLNRGASVSANSIAVALKSGEHCAKLFVSHAIQQGKEAAIAQAICKSGAISAIPLVENMLQTPISWTQGFPDANGDTALHLAVEGKSLEAVGS